MDKYEEINKNTSSQYLIHNPKYPDDRVVAHVIRFLRSSTVQPSNLTAIDIGCGVGRHVKLLDDLNFDAYGIDYADNVATVVTQQFPSIKPDNIYHGDYRNYNFSKKFDLILMWGTVFRCKKSQVIFNLLRLKELLNQNGQLILNFRSKNNWFYGLGEKIEEDSYFIDERGKEYAGYIYSFFEKSEIDEMIQKCNLKVVECEKVNLIREAHLSNQEHEWWIYRIQNSK